MSIFRSPMTTEGYFIPFNIPLSIPAGDVTLYPDRMLRFPSWYVPYIIGALKPLARVETYKAESDAELKFAYEQGMQMLCGIEDIPVPQTNLYFGLSASSDNGSIFTSVSDSYTDRYIQRALIADELDGATSLTITLRSHPDGALAGGSLDVILDYLPVASKAYVVTGHSCTGLISETGFLTDGHHTWHWDDAKDVQISFSAVYGSMWEISTQGNLVCGDV